MNYSRRDFVKTGAVTIAGSAALLEAGMLRGETLRLPLGLQLYSVRDLLPKDFAGTLKELGALGFREVESAGYDNHSAPEVRQALQDAGLKLVSTHHASDDLHKRMDEILDFEHQLGVSFIICSYPGKNPNGKPNKTPLDPRSNGFTLDDWRWNADQFNLFGEKVKSAGMQFGYHNHHLEFAPSDGVLPFDELMRLTDPSKVTFEMDCGWVFVGGGDPLTYLRKYPKRISMLHVKDFKKNGPGETGEPKVEELGKGSIDYRPIFEEAAKTGHVKHCFVEQEAFTIPWKESLKVDADYMRHLGAV